MTHTGFYVRHGLKSNPSSYVCAGEMGRRWESSGATTKPFPGGNHACRASLQLLLLQNVNKMSNTAGRERFCSSSYKSASVRQRAQAQSHVNDNM